MTTQDGINTGHALLIGIDSYVSAPPLQGCSNDVQLMASVLPRFGFLPGHIHKLVDAAATRQAILDGLDHLLHVAEPQEVVVVHFSGWGLRVPRGVSGSDRIITPWGSSTRDAYATQKAWLAPSKSPRGKTAPGAALLDEMTSALVPHDWDGTVDTAITYDELRAWAARIPDRNLVLVFDAPYAGGLVEGNEVISSGHVFIGASRYDELCMEFQAASGVYQGALTYYLAQALTEAEPGATYRDVFYRVSANVSARIPYQHPQLQGNADAPLFATGQAASTGLITVIGRKGDLVTLNVGAASGATVRSQWAVYPASTPDTSVWTAKLGLVEITAVRATQADARILSESGREIIQPGAMAVEEAHFFGEMRLAVRIEAPQDLQEQRDMLVKLLVGSELLKLVQGAAAPDTPDVTLYLLPPRSAAAETDPVPQLEELTEPTWAAVDRAKTLVMAPVSAMGSAAAYEVRDKLEGLSRYRNVLGLRNPNTNSPLAGKVRFTIMRQQADGRWTQAEADRQGGIPVFLDGERIGLEIVNDHSAPVFVAVLDFGLTASVSMLYPSEGPAEQISPGQPLRLGVDPGEEIELCIEGEIGGTETLKLFTTVYQTDLGRLLLQEGGRGVYNSQGEGTTLWQLLDVAMTGVGSRDLRPVRLPPEQEWATVERAFELRRER